MQEKPDRPGWTILLSRNVRGSMDFYRIAMGWTFQPLPGTPYPCWVASEGGGASVAVFVDASTSDFPDATELWIPYFRLDDLDRSILEAEKLGATILRAATEIAGFGRVALLRQPGGSIVGWLQPPALATARDPA